MSQDWPSWLPLRGNLRELSAYGAPQLPADAVLNTNENPYAPSPELAQAIAARVLVVAATLNRYPDRDALALRTKLAEFVNSLFLQPLSHLKIFGLLMAATKSFNHSS